MRVVALVAVVLLVPVASSAAEIHRCPQPDGTTRFQDRPCGPAPPAAPPAADESARSARGEARAPAPPRDARSAGPSRPVTGTRASSNSSPRPPVGEAPVVQPFEPPVTPVTPGAALPTDRRAYVERNAARCRDGNRRACAAVTCEKSGRLDSPACQEAVGYVRGPGWDLRPRSDLFDEARVADEYTLTCRGGGRRVTLQRPRGAEAYAWPGRAEPVARAALPDVARAFCAAGD